MNVCLSKLEGEFTHMHTRTCVCVSYLSYACFRLVTYLTLLTKLTIATLLKMLAVAYINAYSICSPSLPLLLSWLVLVLHIDIFTILCWLHSLYDNINKHNYIGDMSYGVMHILPVYIYVAFSFYMTTIKILIVVCIVYSMYCMY